MPVNQTRIAVVDDHPMLRKGLISLISMYNPNTMLVFEAGSAAELKEKICSSLLPDVIMMDIMMPGEDGFETVKWLKENYASVKVLVLSMIEREEAIVQMIRLGARGYLTKDTEPEEIGQALDAVINKGFYYTDYITGKLVNSVQRSKSTDDFFNWHMNKREKAFLQLACSELTYSQIAGRMNVSPKTIDGYRNALFEKLNVKTRVGLALHAVKFGLVEI